MGQLFESILRYRGRWCMELLPGDSLLFVKECEGWRWGWGHGESYKAVEQPLWVGKEADWARIKELSSNREEPAEAGYNKFVMEPVSMAMSFSLIVLGNTETTWRNRRLDWFRLWRWQDSCGQKLKSWGIWGYSWEYSLIGWPCGPGWRGKKAKKGRGRGGGVVEKLRGDLEAFKGPEILIKGKI